jgi:hypothetical protein
MADLIYDAAGMHQGKDSKLYLNQGFRLVAIEANSDLVSLLNCFNHTMSPRRLSELFE